MAYTPCYKSVKIMAYKDETKKEFICRQCGTFLDTEDLKDGKCPKCDTDEDIYPNDLLSDESE